LAGGGGDISSGGDKMVVASACLSATRFAGGDGGH
jgi:hypothetical protein